MKHTTFAIFTTEKTVPIEIASAAQMLWIILTIIGVYWNATTALAGWTDHDLQLATVVLSGETITVTTLNDESDFEGFQQVTDLPGPDGRVSFREAVTAVNNTPGPQTIAFAIPVSEFWLLQGVALLKLEEGAFFLTDPGTTIDFSTQTINVGDTNPSGPEVGIYGLQPNGWGVAAIFMNGNDSVVKGLGNVYQRGYAVQIVGNNNRVIGCQIDGPLHSAVNVSGYIGGPTPTGNIIGGTASGEGNTLVGLDILGPADSTVVIGNPLLVGVRVEGAPQYGVVASNNRIGGTTAAERNVISGNGKYGEEGLPTGSQVSIVNADTTLVEGNYIGTTADGMAAYVPQIGPGGVDVRDSRNTTVRNNLISGLRVVGRNHYEGVIFGVAVSIGGVNYDVQNTLVEGNIIGLAADGVTPIPTRLGVSASSSLATRHIFGTRLASNHIGAVETTGIIVGTLENGVTITGNSIHDSGGIGIDLRAGNTAGVTPNDPGDADTGGNGLQNFPALQSASTTGSSVTIEGTLDSVPSEQFTIEFFANTACDPSGFGEGKTFLGSTIVQTDGAGHAAFAQTLTASIAAGMQVTATATRTSTGDTSELSACLTATAGSAATPTASATSTPTGTPSNFISGTVRYGNAIASPAQRVVSNVAIDANGSPSVSTTTSFPEGGYLLSGLGSGPYTVTPTKTGGTNGSITSFDAAKIAQHVAGVGVLTGNQFVVADVSGNGALSSFDAGQVARYVVGTSGFGSTGSWIFKPVNKVYQSVTANLTGEDYSALLMGEVSGNWTNTAARPKGLGKSESPVEVKLPNLVMPIGKEIVLPVMVQGIVGKGVISYEFDLRYDPSVMQPRVDPVDIRGTISRGLSVVTNATEPGLLRVVAYGPMPIDGNGVLLNLRFISVGKTHARSPLIWERILFNEGTKVTSTNGQVMLHPRVQRKVVS